MELETKIADLGFSAKPYFLYNFFFKNFVWKCFSQNLKFYVCGLRSETENCKKYFLFWNFWKNKSKYPKKFKTFFEWKFEEKIFFYFGIFEKINPKNPQKNLEKCFEIFWIFGFIFSKKIQNKKIFFTIFCLASQSTHIKF